MSCPVSERFRELSESRLSEELYAAVPDDVRQQLTPVFLQTKLPMEQHSAIITRSVSRVTTQLVESAFKAYPSELSTNGETTG